MLNFDFEYSANWVDYSSSGQWLQWFISSKLVIPHQKRTLCQTSAERTVERFSSCCGRCCRGPLVMLMPTDSAGVLIYRHRFTDCAVCRAPVRHGVKARLHLDIVTPLIASASLMRRQWGILLTVPDLIIHSIYLLPEVNVWGYVLVCLGVGLELAALWSAFIMWLD